MKRLARVFQAVSNRSRLTIALLLVATVAVGSGLPHLETGTDLQQFEGDSVEAEKLDYVRENFSSVRENVTVAQVVVRDDDVLDRETLVATLELQRAIRDNETIRGTLADERPTVGLANVVARAAIRCEDPGATAPTLDEQVAQLRSMSDAAVERLVAATLDGESDGPASRAFVFVPDEYEPGSATANATMLVVFQSEPGDPAPGQADDRIVDSQLAIQSLASERDVGRDAFVVGNGIVSDEMQRAQQDSMRLVAPLALLFVLLTLVFAYRDALDIALGLLGVGLVLVWTFGALGWLGIGFSPTFVAVPVLLIGLSIDFAIHVFMRYREERVDGGTGVRDGMRSALSSVGVALVLVTLTTAIGFLSTLVSPVAPIRDVGLISAVGIVSALVVFGALVPALKVELDGLLERVGLDRAKRPIGTGEGRFTAAVSVGVRAAATSPVAVLLAVLLVSAGATYGATQVSTSFEPQDFFPEDTPEWMDDLPAGVQPGEYTAKRNAAYANDRFVNQGSQAEILVEGDVTDPATLSRMDAVASRAASKDTVHVLATGEAEVRTPLSVMRRVAATHESFAATFDDADTDGDGVPDRNVERLYDELYATAPDQARTVVHRDGGAYRAVRLVVAVDDGASSQQIRAEMRDLAAVVEDDAGPSLTATATGQPVVFSLVQDDLLETLVGSLLVTLVAVLLLLMVLYRFAYGSATLGLVTLLPVVFAVSWIVASMTLLGIPLSVLTALVASLTIGIGVDYCIHFSERFVDELAAGRPTLDALTASVRGTGSALFGSAVTTMSGFGVLAIAVLPLLQQFGTVTALTVAYAFVASVLVLPSLLLLWSRYVDVPGVDAGHPGRPAASVEDD